MCLGSTTGISTTTTGTTTTTTTPMTTPTTTTIFFGCDSIEINLVILQYAFNIIHVRRGYSCQHLFINQLKTKNKIKIKIKIAAL